MKIHVSNDEAVMIAWALEARADTLIDLAETGFPNQGLKPKAEEYKALAHVVRRMACLPELDGYKSGSEHAARYQTTPDNPTWKVGDRVRVADTRCQFYGKAGTVFTIAPSCDRPVMVSLDGAHYAYYEHIELEAEHKP